MKVILIVDFHFTDSTGVVGKGVQKFVTEFDMPASPGGLNSIALHLGTLPVHLPVQSVIWNTIENAFVVESAMKVDVGFNDKLRQNPHWRSFEEYLNHNR